LPSKFDHKL
jgi:hypothetical protein